MATRRNSSLGITCTEIVFDVIIVYFSIYGISLNRPRPQIVATQLEALNKINTALE